MPCDPPSSTAVAGTAERALDRAVVDVKPVEEGLNAVYRVEFADRDPAVLKTATLATDAELFAEARILRRVGSESSVPVPEIHATVRPEEGPLRVAAVLTAHCEGRTVTDLLALPESARERLVRESGRHLAALHGLNAGGVGGFGALHVEDGSLVADPKREDWSWRFRELSGEVLNELRGEGYTTDDDPRFADLAPAVREGLTGSGPPVGEGSTGGRAVSPSIGYGDYRPANLVLARRNNADPIIRAVVDFGGCSTVDPLLDLALAEDALVDVPLGGTERGERLRGTLRAAYGGERDRRVEPESDPRYGRYRLYARTRRMGAFGYWSRFAREDRPDAVARRWRSFVRARLAELG